MEKKKKKDEGGGEYRILRNGKIFDKVGVNFSKVYGKFPKKFQKIYLELRRVQNFGHLEFQS